MVEGVGSGGGSGHPRWSAECCRWRQRSWGGPRVVRGWTLKSTEGEQALQPPRARENLRLAANSYRASYHEYPHTAKSLRKFSHTSAEPHSVYIQIVSRRLGSVGKRETPSLMVPPRQSYKK